MWGARIRVALRVTDTMQIRVALLVADTHYANPSRRSKPRHTQSRLQSSFSSESLEVCAT